MARKEVTFFPGLAVNLYRTVGRQGNAVLGMGKDFSLVACSHLCLYKSKYRMSERIVEVVQ